MDKEIIKELTDRDRKVLKYEKRIGFVFSGLLICFGGLFNLLYFVSNNIHNYLMIGLADLGILLIAYFVCNRINLNVNRDLKDNKKELLKKSVDKKIEEKTYEAGSGTLYIPILGDLFPNLWGQKMRDTRKFYVLTSNTKYEIDKEIYDNLKEDSDFYIHIAKHSETVLGFSND